MNARHVLALRVAVLLCASLFACLRPALAQPAPLRMALIPYLSPNVLVPLFQF